MSTAETTAPAVDGRSRRWDEHRAARRRALLDAAIAAIEDGGAEIGVDAIAERAGVSRTVLYRYFDGRDELQRAVARRAVELLLAKLTRPLRGGRTPRQMIAGVVRAHVRWLDEHPELYRLVATRSAPAASGRAAFAEGETMIAKHLSDLLGHYMALLGVSDAAVHPLVFGLIGMVESAGDWWVRHRDGSGLSRRRLVEAVSDSIWYVIDGHLRARGAQLAPDQPLPEFSSQGSGR